MNLQSAINIIEFLTRKIESQRIPEKYENLLTMVTAMTDKPDKNVSSRLARAKHDLTVSLGETEPVDWSKSRRSALSEIDHLNIIGLNAVRMIEKIFEDCMGDPEKLSAELRQRLESTRSFISSGSATKKFLELFIAREKSCAEKTTLTLLFEGRTMINTISDLERNTRIWNSILNDFSLLTGSECKPIIDDIDNKSLTVSLPGGDNILSAISFGAKRVMEAYAKILRIRKLQLEVKKLSLNNGLDELLDSEISGTINDISEIVVTEMMEKYNGTGEDFREELFNRIKKSFKLILDFIEKGGRIEFQLSGNDKGIEECNRILGSAYQIVCEIAETEAEITALILSREPEHTGVVSQN